MMSNTVIFIAQMVTILAFVGVSFGLYRLLVDQKDATIEAIRERLETERARSPMTITKTLDERVSIMERELERMKTENIELRTRVEKYEQEAELEKEERNITRYFGLEMKLNLSGDVEELMEVLRQRGELESYKEWEKQREEDRESQGKVEQVRQYLQMKRDELRKKKEKMEKELEDRRKLRDTGDT